MPMGTGVAVAEGIASDQRPHVIGLSGQARPSAQRTVCADLRVISADGLITLERVMQDGTKIRAKAAADSFRRQQRVEQGLKEAKAQVAAVEAMSEEEGSRRMAKAR